MAALAASAALHAGGMALLAHLRVEDAPAAPFAERPHARQSGAIPSGDLLSALSGDLADSLSEASADTLDERLDALAPDAAPSPLPDAPPDAARDPAAAKVESRPDDALPDVSWKIARDFLEVSSPEPEDDAPAPASQPAPPAPAAPAAPLLSLPQLGLPDVPRPAPGKTPGALDAHHREAAERAAAAIPLPALPLPSFAGAAGALDELERKSAPFAASGAGGRPRFGENAPPPPKPPDAVMPEIDEKTLEMEKDAIRKLLDEADPESTLRGAVEFSVRSGVCADEPEWRYFELRMTPGTLRPLGPVPKDFVLMIDTSASIRGEGVECIAAESAALLKDVLSEGDRFIIVSFTKSFNYFFSAWMPKSAANIENAGRKLKALMAGSDTDFFNVVKSVLRLPRDPSRPIIAVAVTDAEIAKTDRPGYAAGQITDDSAVTVKTISEFSRLNGGMFSLNIYGVGNSYRSEMARLLVDCNRGCDLHHNPYDRRNYASRLREFLMRFRDPLLTDMAFTFTAGVEARSGALQNLYAGGAVVVRGRCRASAASLPFTLRGLHGPEAMFGHFAVSFGDDLDQGGAAALRREWAWDRMRELQETEAANPSDAGRAAIRELSIKYIMTGGGK